MTPSKPTTGSLVPPKEDTSPKRTRGKRGDKRSLTSTAIENAKPKDSTYFIWDREEEGFGVRVTPAGGKAYVVKLLVQGKQVWKTIGKISKGEKHVGKVEAPKLAQDTTNLTDHEPSRSSVNRTLTVSEARGLAQAYRNKARKGIAPDTEEEKPKLATSISDLVKKFIEEYVETKLGEGSRYGYKRHLNKLIEPLLGEYSVRDLDSSHVAAFHHGLRKTPRQANQAVAILRKMMNLAESWKLRPTGSNPCIHVDKFPEEPRERYLSHEELEALGEELDQAAANHSQPIVAIAALRLLMFTGARHNEILKLKWSQVNKSEKYLLFSRREHKTGKKKGPKKIPLGRAAVGVLDSIDPVPGNPYVFPGHVKGQPFVGLQKIWERIRIGVSFNEAVKVEERRKKPEECLSIEDVRIHDLRHTFASIGASDGQSLLVIGSVLGHSQPSVTNRYAHLQEDPRHEVAETISDIIAKSLEGKSKTLLTEPE